MYELLSSMKKIESIILIHEVISEKESENKDKGILYWRNRIPEIEILADEIRNYLA